jgi:hypothetical protein
LQRHKELRQLTATIEARRFSRTDLTLASESWLTPITLQWSSYAEAERILREERATLTVFDNDLDRFARGEKQAVSDFEAQTPKIEKTTTNEVVVADLRHSTSGSQKRMCEFS